MQKSKITLAAFALALAFGSGAFLEYQVSFKPLRPAPQLGEVVGLRAENDRLEKEISGLRAQIASGSRDHSQAVAESMRILRRDLSGHFIPISKKDLRLTNGFVELFGLTAGEQRALQVALDGARARITELTRANATVSMRADGSAVIEVLPFPADGGKIYDDLIASFSQTLGTERNTEFASLGGVAALDDAFGYFGTSKADITVSWTPSADPASYDYKLHYAINSGQGVSANGLFTVGNSQSLPPNLFAGLAQVQGAPMGLGIDLLPADFGPKK